MLHDTTYNPAFDDSDDEDINVRIAHNTAVSVKQGLACGNIEEPGYKLKLLVQFASKMKEHRTVIFQTSTTERLQREAQAEAQLRRKPLTQKNISFEITGKYKSIQSV